MKLVWNLLKGMFKGESSLQWTLFLFCLAVFFSTAFFTYLVQGMDKYQRGGAAWEAGLSGLCLAGLIFLVWLAGGKTLAAWGRERKQGKFRKLYLLGIFFVLASAVGFVAFLPPHTLLVNDPSDFVLGVANFFPSARIAKPGISTSISVFCLGYVLMSNFGPGPYPSRKKQKLGRNKDKKR